MFKLPPKKQRTSRVFASGGAEVAVKIAAVVLECADDVHRRHSFSSAVLGIGNSVADDFFKKISENRACFFVYKTRNALYPAAARKASNSRFGDAIDSVAKNFSVALWSSLAINTTLSNCMWLLSLSSHG